MRAVLVMCLLTAMGLAGCSGGGDDVQVREITIHIGYNKERTQQYFTPKEIHATQGENIRLVITNDDLAGAPDSFHDVAFRLPGYADRIEHEVAAGRTVKTCIVLETPCPEGKDYFTVREKGSFKMWCEVGPRGSNNPDGTPKTAHEQMGMWGTLIVS